MATIIPPIVEGKHRQLKVCRRSQMICLGFPTNNKSECTVPAECCPTLYINMHQTCPLHRYSVHQKARMCARQAEEAWHLADAGGADCLRSAGPRPRTAAGASAPRCAGRRPRLASQRTSRCQPRPPGSRGPPPSTWKQHALNTPLPPARLAALSSVPDLKTIVYICLGSMQLINHL